MRNVFDQFRQPENQLTHALVCSLCEDRRLLKRFIRWATGDPAPSDNLHVIEQSLPGEESAVEIPEQQRRSLPDGWISTDDGWALLIESKIGCSLQADQINRHRSTAQRRGFTQISILALVLEIPKRVVDAELRIRSWADLYKWLKGEEKHSEWARRLSEYMAILEAKLVNDEILKAGTLTVFTGIPFSIESPYNYPEAKRVLRLAMDELQRRSDLHVAFGIDRHSEGRPGITGKKSSLVWDYLPLGASSNARSFTNYPHLTLGLHREFLQAIVVIPNGIRTDFRRNLLGRGQESFRAVFSAILQHFEKELGGIAGAVPWLELIQRRYPAQRAEPFVDALLEFDLRTAFPNSDSGKKRPQWKPQWLQSVYEALSNRKGNLQLATGVRFTYSRCPDANQPLILNHIANAWISCKPLVDRLLNG